MEEDIGVDATGLRIEITPMPQRSEVRNMKEDWTGKSSTALRRKLQNRLNKRASSMFSPHPACIPSNLLGKRKSQGSTSKHPELEPEQDFQFYSLTDTAALNEGVAQFQSVGPRICMSVQRRQNVTSAPDFRSYIRTPLPTDQKLLTLLHFNLVRALTRNIVLLRCDPEDMSLDINSPFAPQIESMISSKGIAISELPPTMRPTTVQMTVPHHIEIDMYPFPRYRDNLILAGSTIDDVELCTDMLYGVDLDEELDPGNIRDKKRKCTDGPFGTSGRTGLIVWADPWLQESWEVDEGFARKYARLLRGCDALLRSTNHWRATRGEKRLDWR
jgi:hypothetical protein